MPQTWKPTSIGRAFTNTPDWIIATNGESFVLTVSGKSLGFSASYLTSISVTPGVFWSTITIPLQYEKFVSLDGISNKSARRLKQEIDRIAEDNRNKRLAAERAQKHIKECNLASPLITEWANSTETACRRQLKSKGWLTHEFIAEQIRTKPNFAPALFEEPVVIEHLQSQPQEVRQAITFWKKDFRGVADAQNTHHLETSLREDEDFFKQVEKTPLTAEQAKAVVCFDNRVLLVASAGSGKTSTMVAKAGYALKKGYFAAENMLLLAFNKKAADELKERITARLNPLGLPADRVVAKTFHAFGLDVIGKATGKRPSIAAWVESGREIETILELVDDLKDRDGIFRTYWDLYRVVLGQDLPAFGKETESPDSWNYEQKKGGFWTLNNEVVRSRGELIIANWLWYNGVNYQYEAPYKVDTADAQYRQYHPDFYFPDIDTYLEHWALDQHGNAPPQFQGYKDGIAWKRQLHLSHGTRLLETTMADLWSGKAFKYLEEQLTRLGIRLDPNPDRTALGRRPIENPRLAKTFRTFLTHAKSNRATISSLHQRLNEGDAGRFHYRHQIFLNLFEQIWAAWENKLRQDKAIDFEDMLGQAADCIESGKWESPYELVMVDEFQDASQARARLVAGLVQKPDRCLFAVGDDWQSINRFAGSDLSVMTDFERMFGKAITLRLETTFRCPQSLCDISSAFVRKNPRQIKKRVVSAKSNVLDPVRIIQVKDEYKIRSAVAKRIEEIAASTDDTNRKPKIYVLGRYNQEQEYLPMHTDPRVLVEFVTVHSSKGLEADHVIVPKMTSDVMGFPSRIEDDPVMQLAMPNSDEFEFAEERRLFYVALTRSRETATLITIERKESSFVTELVREHKLQVLNLDGEKSNATVCPKCSNGLLTKKKGKYGPFLGCSRYPKCDYTIKIPNLG